MSKHLKYDLKGRRYYLEPLPKSFLIALMACIGALISILGYDMYLAVSMLLKKRAHSSILEKNLAIRCEIRSVEEKTKEEKRYISSRDAYANWIKLNEIINRDIKRVLSSLPIGAELEFAKFWSNQDALEFTLASFNEDSEALIQEMQSALGKKDMDIFQVLEGQCVQIRGNMRLEKGNE